MGRLPARFLVVVGLLIVASCAGRDASPVAANQPFDMQLSCAQMLAEVQNNEQKALGVAKERESSRGRNVAVGVVGALLFWPALFALDVTDTERVELEALNRRNDKLNMMIAQRCDPGTLSVAVEVVPPPNPAYPMAVTAAGPPPTPTTHDAGPIQCQRYADDQAMWVDCVVLTSADGDQLIPTAARGSDLHARVACHRFRKDTDVYLGCLAGAASGVRPVMSSVASAVVPADRQPARSANRTTTPGIVIEAEPASLQSVPSTTGLPDQRPQCEPLRAKNPSLWAMCRSIAAPDRARIVPVAGVDAPLGARLACQNYKTAPELYAPCLQRNAGRSVDSFH